MSSLLHKLYTSAEMGMKRWYPTEKGQCKTFDSQRAMKAAALQPLGWQVDIDQRNRMVLITEFMIIVQALKSCKGSGRRRSDID